MSAATVYTILQLGFDASEQRLLRTLFALSRQGTRRWHYQNADSDTTTVQDLLVLVNVDNDEALTHYWLHFAHRKDVIVVLASREPVTQTSYYWIGRPLRASSLMATLDQAVTDQRSAQAARQKQAQGGTFIRRTLYRQLAAMTFGYGFYKA